MYKEVNLLNQTATDISPDIFTVSVDEKTGVQAIKNAASDLPLDLEKGYKQLKRDYEYKRLGTVSILAGLDLIMVKLLPRYMTDIVAGNSLSFSKRSTESIQRIVVFD